MREASPAYSGANTRLAISVTVNSSCRCLTPYTVPMASRTGLMTE